VRPTSQFFEFPGTHASGIIEKGISDARGGYLPNELGRFDPLWQGTKIIAATILVSGTCCDPVAPQ
jgi:hypothetical protein